MSDEEQKTDLLEKLKELDRRDGDEDEVSGSFRGKFKHYWTKFKIKEALGHLVGTESGSESKLEFVIVTNRLFNFRDY